MAGTTTMRPREPDDDRAGTDGADGKRADDAIRAQVDAIDALLPQTQCTRCGFAGCRPYAASVATGGALNRCPPGGARTIRALAELLGRSAPPLDPACGSEAPPALARIDPEACIGCTLCIEACPVDAIVGTARRLHVVLAERCNGCGLCVAPCPVDCIAMPPRPADAGPGPGADANRRHVLARGARRTRLQQGQRERLEALGWPARVECRVAGDGGATLTSCAPAPGEGTAGLPEAVAAALARARARRRAAGPAPHA